MHDEATNPDAQVEPANPLELYFDPGNPRLRRDEQSASQERLLNVMISRFKVEELADSIVTSGFIEFDPMIACLEDQRTIVLEGNRRLAALKLLLDPTLAPEGSREPWQNLSERLSAEQRDRLRRVNVLVFPDRREGSVRAYIGFRHVTGVLQWPPLEKAAYIADLLEVEQWTYSEIAERLGSYPKHVERHYVAHQIVNQALEKGVDGAKRLQNAFGVLMRALQAGGVREFLGVEYPNDPVRSQQPVPAKNLENLRLFVRWTFGTRETQPILQDSRQLTKWGRILSAREATNYLTRTPTPRFERAWFLSGGEKESVADSLYTAADHLEASVPLVSELADQDDIESAVRRCARFLQQILLYFPRIAEEHGFAERQGSV